MTYLHLGGDTLVSTDNIVGVFDLDNASASYLTREYLRAAQQEGRVVSVTEDLPKSFVLCKEDKKETVYLSFLNAATLLRRWEAGSLE